MPGPEKKAWDLTEKSFHGLLDFLDPDRVSAAAQYEKIREKLTRLFEWRGCIPGSEYADETFDRVARKIEGGIEARPENPYLYFHGVALNVIRERWRRAGRDPEALETLSPAKSPFVDPLEERRRKATEQEQERRLLCLHDCLDGLPPASRELLTSYHLGGSGVHIGRRKGLAEVLNLPAGALRLRVYRIRRQVEKCLGQCLARQGLVEYETFR